MRVIVFSRAVVTQRQRQIIAFYVKHTWTAVCPSPSIAIELCVWLCEKCAKRLLRNVSVCVWLLRCVISSSLPIKLSSKPKRNFRIRVDHLLSRLCATHYYVFVRRALWLHATVSSEHMGTRVHGLRANRALLYSIHANWRRYRNHRWSLDGLARARVSTAHTTIRHTSWTRNEYDVRTSFRVLYLHIYFHIFSFCVDSFRSHRSGLPVTLAARRIYSFCEEVKLKASRAERIIHASVSTSVLLDCCVYVCDVCLCMHGGWWLLPQLSNEYRILRFVFLLFDDENVFHIIRTLGLWLRLS